MRLMESDELDGLLKKKKKIMMNINKNSKAAAASASSSSSSIRRLRREDCHRTKHDTIFSKWQILIGPLDWENYNMGKDGSERYRTHNLPVTCSCPGIYELGLAATRTDFGREMHKLALHQIIVVYLGQADNVRNRLQHYGRAGSHLDHGKNDSSNHQKGPGLFKEVFARGFSVVFRWAPMKSKKDAEVTEALLLGVFDYAWNKIANGGCRRDDIIVKLNGTPPASNPLVSVFRKLMLLKTQVFDVKEVGVSIDAGKPHEEDVSPPEFEKTTGRILKFLKSKPRLVLEAGSEHGSGICGVIKEDGSTCMNRPSDRRKRCPQHKGKRINSRRSMACTEGAFAQNAIIGSLKLEVETNICGVSVGDGIVCTNLPPKGCKRCVIHKGRRITKSKPVNFTCD